MTTGWRKQFFFYHNLITINTAYKRNGRRGPKNNTQGSSPFTKYNLFSDKIKWEEIQRSASEINWDQVMEGDDPNAMLQALTTKLLEICSDYIPVKRQLTTRQKNPHEEESLSQQTPNESSSSGEKNDKSEET